MNTLTLSVKQKYFDEIIAGTKMQEFREIRPTNAKKYLALENRATGEVYPYSDNIPGGDIWVAPAKYDAIKFITGEYKGKRPFAIVEVKGQKIEIFTDENGNELKYEHEGEIYVDSQIIYDLGRVLERS